MSAVSSKAIESRISRGRAQSLDCWAMGRRGGKQGTLIKLDYVVFGVLGHVVKIYDSKLAVGSLVDY